MGLFDSFYVDIDDREVEVQTKRFDQVLQRYRVGDVVSGAPAGVRVYVDSVGFDVDGARVYREEQMARRWTLFIVLGYSLFVAFEAVEGELSGADALARIRALETAWDDSARLMTRMVQALGEKQDRIARLQGQIGYARGTIEDARRIREGEEVRHPLLPDREATKRLRLGDDPLDVLAWLLEDETPDDVALGFRGPYQMAEQDPLEAYRL